MNGDYVLTMDTAIIYEIPDTMLMLSLIVRAEHWRLQVLIYNFPFQNPSLNGIKIKRYSHDDDLYAPGFYSECDTSGTYMVCDDAYFSLGESFNTYAGVRDSSSYVEIIACDTIRRVISGKFNLKLRHEFEFDETIDFSCEFNELCYEIRDY